MSDDVPTKAYEQLSTLTGVTPLAELAGFKPTQVIAIESTTTRTYRYIARKVMQGHTHSEIVKLLQRDLGLTQAWANSRVNEVRERAKLTNDDETVKDIIVAELVKDALQRHQLFHKEAVAPVPDTPLTAAALVQILFDYGFRIPVIIVQAVPGVNVAKRNQPVRITPAGS